MPKEQLSIHGEPAVKKKRRRFIWDDFELTLLSLPTIVWLIAAGIEAVQAEAQAQLDAYLAGN